MLKYIYILIERLTKPGDIKKRSEERNQGRNKELGT
jgi:hypothetical protein